MNFLRIDRFLGPVFPLRYARVTQHARHEQHLGAQAKMGNVGRLHRRVALGMKVQRVSMWFEHALGRGDRNSSIQIVNEPMIIPGV
jgi:hypothetical protein